MRYSAKQTIGVRKMDERYFFNYELNRHHILNLDKVLSIEHSTEPLVKDTNGRSGQTHLSTFDLIGSKNKPANQQIGML
jgi:hypothetical protein